MFLHHAQMLQGCMKHILHVQHLILQLFYTGRRRRRADTNAPQAPGAEGIWLGLPKFKTTRKGGFLFKIFIAFIIPAL